MSKRHVIAGVFGGLLVVVGIGYMVFYGLSALFGSNAGVSGAASRRERSTYEEWSATVKEENATYRLNHSITTVLFLGIDDSTRLDPESAAGAGGRADAIMLVLLDDSAQTLTLVSVSRDTQAPVEMYDTRGDYIGTVTDHLNMQYAFGDSATRSAYLTKKAISRLLYGMRIDSFLSLDMSGMAAAVDALGGLTFTVPGDYTEIDSRYEKGAQVTVNGAEAERLFRYRDIEVTGSAESRIERHLELLEAMFEDLSGKLSGSRLQDMIDSAGDAAHTDLDAETMQKLASYRLNPTTYTLPGTVVEGELHDEFHVDDAALRRLVLSLFYQAQ